MLMVFAGHTGVGLPTLLHLHFFHRTVPVLIFAFGMSVAYWALRYEGAPLLRMAGDFYRTRYPRIFRPWWLMLACWWPAAIWVTDGRLLKPVFIAASAGGYLPYLLPSWFVTVIISLIAVAPLMVWVSSRFGSAFNLLLTYGITTLSYMCILVIMSWSRWFFRDSAVDTLFYMAIFPGCYIGLVAAGMAVVKSRWVPSLRSSAVLGAIYTAGVLIVLRYFPTGYQFPTLLRVLDPILALSLLGLCNSIDAWQMISSGLAWCGRRSWALYLVHIPTFDLFTRLGIESTELSFVLRLSYCVALIAGTVAVIRVGDFVRARVAHLVHA
jgi:peptidoglycan/LPS O-acetylase OafA/YrhL